jgi:hypothetical protein
MFIAVIGAASCLVGCSKKPTEPTESLPIPPAIARVHPEPRATGVRYQTDIWAEMAEPLDPTTVNEASVFLKLDTGRIPIDVAWGAASRRIIITPREPLALRRTHTVELSSAIRSEAGHPLEPYFWQFTTLSLRSLVTPRPPTGAVGVSPFAPLAWDSTESAAGQIRYSVWFGADSQSVSSRGQAPALVSPRALMLPASKWGPNRSIWWAVSVENLSTGEVEHGPAWFFETVSSGTPVDSVIVPALQWGQASNFGGSVFQSCFGSRLSASASSVSAIDWDFVAAGSGRVLADAALVLASGSGNLSAQTFTLWATVDPWSACAVDYPGPPYRDLFVGSLATGEVLSSNRLRYRSDLLTSHVQARIEGFRTPGYLLASTGEFTFGAPGTTTAAPPVLMLKYYVIGGAK